MPQRNIFLAILLSISFMAVWFGVVVPRFTPPPAPSVPATIPPDTRVAGTPATLAAAHPENAALANQPESFLRDPENEVILVPAGAAVRQWRLKLKNQEIDLVEPGAAGAFPLATFPNASFSVRQQSDAGVMTATVAQGITLTKTLRLDPEGFLNDLTLEFTNTTAQALELKDWEMGWGPGLGTTESERSENPAMTRAISLQTHDAIALDPGEYSSGRWAAVDNRYYMVAFIPPPEAAPRLIVTGEEAQTRIALRHTTTIPARGRVTLRYQLYVGPKGYTHLKQYGKGLEAGVDFGWFSSLGKLILNSLYALQKWTGNWGWAIVLLTVALQFLLLPLTLKAFRVQLAMKKMQPKIAALQAKYKGDPKQLNIEMMNLYKKTGTNPFGGCLPMLLQLPIFWALFTTLRNAYELRGAPFIGWITDLSAADSVPGLPILHVLPLLLGAAMFLQQRITGSPTDPMQRQMMTIMPIVFTFMFYGFPSGLALYWLTSSVLSIVFLYIFQKVQDRQGKGTPDSPQIVVR